jgi:hypothetical protein
MWALEFLFGVDIGYGCQWTVGEFLEQVGRRKIDLWRCEAARCGSEISDFRKNLLSIYTE